MYIIKYKRQQYVSGLSIRDLSVRHRRRDQEPRTRNYTLVWLSVKSPPPNVVVVHQPRTYAERVV